MKKRLITLLLTFTSSAITGLYAQEAYPDIENFEAGTVLLFQNCSTDIFEPGEAGENITWDYSKLKTAGGTTTQWITTPGDAPHASAYPEATLVEKYSDEKYVFLKADRNRTYLLGFVDEQTDIKIRYPQPVLIAQRPFSFGETITEPYTTAYQAGGMTFSGMGSVSIEADGSGTLILPHKTYEHTLRIKITQTQSDVLEPDQPVGTTTTVTYVWFDRHHRSALLKMTETTSTHHSDKNIEYLLSETAE